MNVDVRTQTWFRRADLHPSTVGKTGWPDAGGVFGSVITAPNPISAFRRDTVTPDLDPIGCQRDRDLAAAERTDIFVNSLSITFIRPVFQHWPGEGRISNQASICLMFNARQLRTEGSVIG